jgi:hypothetical protein
MKTAISVLCATLLLAGLAAAHHGWTGYDESKAFTIEGVIREVKWENPHVLIRIQADQGKGATWLAYLAPISRMETRGLKQEALKTGSAATLTGYPDKTKPAEMRAERIMIAGKTTELR